MVVLGDRHQPPLPLFTSTMSADTSDLTKVDSAIGVEPGDVVKPIGEKKARKSSSAPGVMNIVELRE